MALEIAPVSRKSLICSAICSATFSCASAVAAPRCGVQIDVIEREQWRIDGWLGLEHIQCRAGDVTGFDGVGESRFIQQTAPRAIDDPHAWPGPRQRIPRQNVLRGVGHRHVQRDDVGPFQQRFEFDLLHAQIERALLGKVRIIGDHFHMQSDAPVGDDRADVAAADHAEGLAGQFDAHETIFLPLAGAGGGIGLRNLPRQSEHHGDRVLGRGDGIAVRRVHHHDAARGG